MTDGVDGLYAGTLAGNQYSLPLIVSRFSAAFIARPAFTSFIERLDHQAKSFACAGPWPAM